MILYLQNTNLLPYNTFRIGVNASHLFFLKSRDELKEIISYPCFREKTDTDRLLILGHGSNILFTKDFDGIIIKNEIEWIKTVRETDEYVIIEAGAGTRWQELVKYCVTRNLGGIANLTLIPGTVGAAPVQNIGAYGTEVAQLITKVYAFHLLRNEWITLNNQECRFGYRDSIFKRELKNKTVICSVQFRLSKMARPCVDYGGIREELEKRKIKQPSPADVSDIVAQIRKSKLPDPAELGNAGSFFKNPVVDEDEFRRIQESFPHVRFFSQGSQYKISAGWLIEQAGWKGFRNNDAGCYEKQALILVNHGHATGKEILELSERIVNSVMDKFGIVLEREVIVL